MPSELCVLEHLLGGIRLLGVSAAFYFTTPLVLLIALFPSAIRTFQLFANNQSGLLELVVEALRVVLVIVMIAVGRNWVGLSGAAWSQLWSDIVHAYRAGWAGILIEMAVVTGIIFAFNALFEALVTESSMRAALTGIHADPSFAKPTANAVTFAVKNIAVIPIYLASMLIASGVIRR